MDIIEAYLSIIDEENYSNEDWEKYDSYRGIDFYINRSGHLLERLNERYLGINRPLVRAFNIMKKFIKEEMKNGQSDLVKKSRSEIPFTVFGKISNMYISGRFKMNRGVWRCYVVTALPNEDTHHSSSDLFVVVDA